MKIQGTSGYKLLEQGKKVQKSQDKDKTFDKVLSDSAKPSAGKDSVTLGSIRENQAAYSPLFVPKSAQKDLSSEVAQTVRKVMEQPEEVRARVSEIKKLIDEGGVEAYFRSIDSQKVSQKLLESGILDDMI